MHKRFFITAAILGALTVAMGAFGAHALKAIVPAEALTIYETAVKYQFYHVFALALTSMLYEKFPNQSLINACILTIKAATGIEWLKYVGPFTPVGGLFFIAGWLQLAWGVKKG
jgi:uncharacterized membrane protein YgdD (TMEM256/DUF423 family)